MVRMADRQRENEIKRRYVAKKGRILNALKVTAGCMDCGYNTHPAALDFDHRPGTEKLSAVAKLRGCSGYARLWAEIDKCDIVCANCHRIRTAERRTS